MRAEIRMGTACYPYRCDTDWRDGIVDRLVELGGSRYLVVCDARTVDVFGTELAARLSRHAPADVLVHQRGEQHKHLLVVNELIDAALRCGADRASIVVAVGGGITGNIAGLVAALLFRGIRLVHVPTTVIAMLDSVLSLKQAVNAGVGKNLVGTFYPPVEVLADTALLRSLPPREVISGMCEVVKNALAIRPQMTGMLLDRLRPDGRYDDDSMYLFITESIAAKAAVTVDDERESYDGLVLEYGHTVGHALEYTAPTVLSHGVAVGLGMLVAAEVSRRLGHLDDDVVDLHYDLVRRAGSLCSIPAEVDVDQAIDRLRYDNKRGYLEPGSARDQCAMVLLKGQGEPLRQGRRAVVGVPRELVAEVVRELADPGRATGALETATIGGPVDLTEEG